MIKFSTRLPFCACFHPTWIGGKQQGSLGKLWLAETWKMVCCYWPYSHWCPLLNLNKVAILTHYFYNVTHFFQTWNLAQSDILPKWFSLKKIVSILALVQILADVIQKAQANSTVHMCLTANPGWEWQYTGFFCSFAMLICVQYKNNRVGNLPWRGFWKKIDFSPTGKVVVMQILVSCIDSFFDSILLFYAKFPFIW